MGDFGDLYELLQYRKDIGLNIRVERGDRMKQYAAFLRGINISGKNRIAMPALKQAMEQAGYKRVIPYLNSGNLLFQSEEGKLSEHIHNLIQQQFDLDIPVHVIEVSRLMDILKHAPSWWGSNDPSRYDNLIFIINGESAEQLYEQVGEPENGLEMVQCHEDVIFWTFDRKRYSKCKWWKKTAQDGIGEKLTIRTAGTIRKLMAKA